MSACKNMVLYYLSWNITLIHLTMKQVSFENLGVLKCWRGFVTSNVSCFILKACVQI